MRVTGDGPELEQIQDRRKIGRKKRMEGGRRREREGKKGKRKTKEVIE